MRRRGGVTTLVLVAVVLGQAAGARETCGIGSRIWDGREGALPWLAASVTNVWTFKGISTTFEIAGCSEEDNLLKKLFAYTSTNMDQLAVQMARGEGEHLDAFAELLGVQPPERAGFGRLLQANLETIVPHDRVHADELLAGVMAVMATHQAAATGEPALR